ncbi:uncharacterized protein LOC110241484 [Exaiptasia diaphana]|uniref:Uncharacterized protein n=1 Tax=Exaiptasia diaphana TaxID=2652724 RepID=A0A913XDZ7_EXADI|nr:uncharacterized protein LOC110241484 [Exaiptasia diaphana]KXJ12846.1 hypothetical protein AC249_AIPGENE8819 [Exaiptasia diaphana]
MYVSLLIILGAYTKHVYGFCSRPYDFMYWEPQTLVQRSIDADIIVYAEVIDSPCKKPAPLTTTPPPTTTAIFDRLNISLSSNSTNQTSEYVTPEPTTTTPAPTTIPLNTSTPIVPGHNCSTEPYNVSLQIHCVIKGGALPEYINVTGLGLGDDICVDKNWNETVHEYHAYHGLNYTFFLKREHNFNPQHDSFTLHPVNVQPAMMEVLNAKKDLLPVFKVAGRHAHAAMDVWVNKTDPICKPYSGASHLTALSVAMAILTSLVAMITSY